MPALYALALAVLQGVTELFPISSLGHAVIVPSLFHWPIDQKAPEFLPFIVVLHVGTATALLLYFWRDWIYILRGLVGRGEYGGDDREARRLLGLIVAATLPAVVIGLLSKAGCGPGSARLSSPRCSWSSTGSCWLSAIACA